MTIADHQELDVTVRAVAPVGCLVTVDGQDDGQEGFVDQAKHPSWWTDVAPPQVGDRLHVVVLDDSRVPPRLSALDSDIETGRALRGRGA
ncbi:hypothetical protein ACFQ0X_17355 [Streptomyces rectiviolaceus]|uniref:TRAM domain-containing protein n=1 Tax=Streptomyces rectiviolaceus TaxID=332591 RepID=A0ABP6MM72_9ACTN